MRVNFYALSLSAAISTPASGASPPWPTDTGARPCGPDMDVSCRQYCANEATSCPDGQAVDVLIIGSGMAGLGAAREIEIFNMATSNPADRKTFRILEGDAGRIGGRANFAQWLSGGAGNPVETIMWENFRNAYRHHYQNWADVCVISKLSGNRVDTLEREFNAAYDCASEYSNSLDFCVDDDPGMLEAFTETCGWVPSSSAGLTTDEAAVRFLLEWYTIPYDYLFGNYRHFANDNLLVSLSNLPDAAYTDFQNWKDYLMTEAGRIAEIASSEYVRYDLCSKMSLDSKVTKIEDDSGDFPIKVTAESSDGSTCTVNAKQVISTLSVGALIQQEDNGIFGLESSADKIAKMESVYEVGNYYEITFHFANNFWTEFQRKRLDRTQFIAVAPTNLDVLVETQCNYIQVMDTAWDTEFFPGSHTIRCVVTTTDYNYDPDESPEDWGPTEVLGFFNAAVLPKLRAAGLSSSFTFQSAVHCIPGQCDIYDDVNHPESRTFWYSLFPQMDELTGGSYSSWKTMENGATSYQNFTAYAAPIKVGSGDNYVFWSGTCTCPRHYEFTQGGLYSGIRDGKKALAALGVSCDNIPTTKYLCQPDGVEISDSYNPPHTDDMCTLVTQWQEEWSGVSSSVCA